MEKLAAQVAAEREGRHPTAKQSKHRRPRAPRCQAQRAVEE